MAQVELNEEPKWATVSGTRRGSKMQCAYTVGVGKKSTECDT